MSDKFKFTVDNAKKVVLISASGMFSKEDALELKNDFIAQSRAINSKDYSLIVDSKEVKPNSPDVVPLLEEMLVIYKDTPYKKKIAVLMDSAVAMMQIKRIGKDSFTDTFSIATSLDQAYTMI